MEWKRVARKMIRRLGYDAHRIVTTAEGHKFGCVCGWSTYCPWLEPWFQDVYDKIAGRTVCSEDRCYVLYQLAKQCAHLEGDFAECGVYKGGTAYLIAHAVKTTSAKRRQLHLFDTFEGMPSTAVKERDSHREGDFGDVSLDRVRRYLSEFDGVVFHQGLIPDTFRSVQDKQFSFVHVDVDLYPTTRDCCQFFYSRIVSGGILVFDDYGFPGYEQAERRAVDEFFRDKPESLLCLHTGQCIVIKV